MVKVNGTLTVEQVQELTNKIEADGYEVLDFKINVADKTVGLRTNPQVTEDYVQGLLK